MTRVLVAEDCACARALAVSILDGDPALTVVGEAVNGKQAVEMAASLQPDVITMDVRMPVMDGLHATRQIMAATPRPIVCLSTDEPTGVRSSFRALEAGAVAVLGKPEDTRSPDFPQQAAELQATVKAVRGTRVVPPAARTGFAHGAPAVAGERPSALFPRRAAAAPQTVAGHGIPASQQRRVDLVAIGSSTGGPAALAKVLGSLPGDLPVPVLVAQHVTRGFDAGLAEWLDGVSPLRVRLAADRAPLRAGEVLIAPSDSQLGVSPASRSAVLTSGPALDARRPSATHLFTSVARAYGRHTLAVVLTGMGEDGARGLVGVQQSGGWVVAQDEASCVAYGMPAAALARGVVNEQVPLDEVAGTILAVLRRGRA